MIFYINIIINYFDMSLELYKFNNYISINNYFNDDNVINFTLSIGIITLTLFLSCFCYCRPQERPMPLVPLRPQLVVEADNSFDLYS